MQISSQTENTSKLQPNHPFLLQICNVLLSWKANADTYIYQHLYQPSLSLRLQSPYKRCDKVQPQDVPVCFKQVVLCQMEHQHLAVNSNPMLCPTTVHSSKVHWSPLMCSSAFSGQGNGTVSRPVSICPLRNATEFPFRCTWIGFSSQHFAAFSSVSRKTPFKGKG